MFSMNIDCHNQYRARTSLEPIGERNKTWRMFLSPYHRHIYSKNNNNKTGEIIGNQNWFFNSYEKCINSN